MLLSVILFMLAVPGDATDVTRDFFGDIFRMRDCHNGSRCDNGGRRPALQVPGRPCYCQCAPSHLAYREDKQQCVKDVKECYMSVFYRPFSIEAIPLVYLPTSGQLVHPDAHLSLSMRRNFEGGLAKCKVTVSQYLTKEGWRTIVKMDGTGGSVFGLFTDANKTYLQFLGNSQDRRLLQQHMVLIRLLCMIPQYPAFETCVAIRIGWVPGIENIDAPTNSNKSNMMVVGLSLGILALVYISAVLVYLKIRRQMIAKQKASTDQEAKLQSRDDNSDKASTLHRMEPSNRLELYHTASLGRIKPSKKGYRNNTDPWSQMSPVIETYNRTWTDRMGQHSSEFRAQDFKLQPEFFEPEFMASPPHEVLEYLERLQNSITFARHRMRSCYRYQPTLNGIPEDDYFYQELEKKEQPDKNIRTTPDGGSASSVGSLKESTEEKNDTDKRDVPKVPPRKPKRKASNKNESPPEHPQGSDQEQKEIQKAMNTLNDTLNALEFDMYKQEISNQASDTETGNLSCQNSTSIDFDDFETSSCSSVSAVTILGRDARRQSDISKCSQYVEKNQAEEVSTFSNSTYSLCDAMIGLFHDGNKASNNNESEKSNFSSRCSSRAGYVPHTDEISINQMEQNQRVTNNKEEINAMKQENTEEYTHRNVHLNRNSDNSNTLFERNATVAMHEKNCWENSENKYKEYAQNNLIDSNYSENGIRNSGKHTYFSASNHYSHRNSHIADYLQNGEENRSSPSLENCLNGKIIASEKVNEFSKVNASNPESRQKQNSVEIRNRKSKSPNSCYTEDRNVRTPNHENIRNIKSKSPIPLENERVNCSTPNGVNGHYNNLPSHHEKKHRNIYSPGAEKDKNLNTSVAHNNYHRSTTPQLENGYLRTKTPNENHLETNAPSNRITNRRNFNMEENDQKSSSDSESYCNTLKRSNSTESMNTVVTDMTVDSLDSRCTTPSHPSPTPSLMEMWINKLVSTSVPYSKNRRKSKKKLILPEDEVDSWEHVCQKHKDPCPKQELNSSEPNLIDKLAHYSSKTMAGCDVAGYFQTLKQDVLKEHLKQWLTSNNQNKKLKKGISLEYNNECSHKKPLVNGQENTVIDDTGMHCSNNNGSVTELKEIQNKEHDFSIIDDSLERNSPKNLKENGSIYFGGQSEINKQTVQN